METKMKIGFTKNNDGSIRMDSAGGTRSVVLSKNIVRRYKRNHRTNEPEIVKEEVFSSKAQAMQKFRGITGYDGE